MKNFIYNVLIFITCVISSCTNNDTIIAPTPETIPKIKLAEGYSAATKIELYSDDTLRTGYSRFYIRLLDSATNSVIRDAQIVVTPIMDMISMKHSCPTEQTPTTQITGELFPFAAIFTMAESNEYKWTININFLNRISDRESSISFPITVVSGLFSAKIFSITDDKQLILAMLPIVKPIVGMNNIEFAVYTKNRDQYTSVNDLTTVITPEMPSMGHGSPNNVNPLSIGNGHYSGKVNFIMTGEWKINLALLRDGNEIGREYFMITL